MSMSNSTIRRMRLAFVSVLITVTLARVGQAKFEFPQFVNDWCTAQNRIPAQPISTAFPTGCETCHQAGTFDTTHVVLPAFQEMKSGNYAWFCPLLANSNQPPVLAPVGNQTATEGSALSISLSATDVDGGTLAFSASDLPPGASLTDAHDGTAAFAWTPGYDQAGNYLVTFTVTDDAVPPGSDSEQIAITVGNLNRPPVLAAIGAHAGEEGVALAFSISATDPDGDPLHFAGADMPTGAQLTDHGDGTADFDWMPGYDQAGNFNVTVSVSDTGSPVGVDSETFTLSVGNVNRPPVLATVGNRSVTAEQVLQITLSAADPDGDLLQFAAAGLPTGADFQDGGNGGATFSWMPTADQLGNFEVIFSVTDSGQPMASDSETVVISVGGVNRPPVLGAIGSRSIDAGTTLTVPLTATDPDGDLLSFSASGMPAGAELMDHGDGSAEFNWTPGFDQVGNHSVTFSVNDSGSPSESDFEEVTLSVGAVNRPPVLDPIGAHSVFIGDALHLAITAHDPDGDDLAFEAIDLPPGASFTDNLDGTAVLDWTPTADQIGAYPLTVVVRDSGSPTAEDAESVEVRAEEMPAEPPVTYDLTLRAISRRWLMLRGGAVAPGAEVSIVDGDSGDLLVVAIAGADGSFRALLRSRSVPCTVQARADSHWSPVIQVERAPASCGAAQTGSGLDVLNWSDDEKDEREVELRRR